MISERHFKPVFYSAYCTVWKPFGDGIKYPGWGAGQTRI